MAHRYIITEPDIYVINTESWVASCRIVQGFVLGNTPFMWLLQLRERQRWTEPLGRIEC